MNALSRLEKSILAREDEISQALKADLNKSPFESYMSETGMVLSRDILREETPQRMDEEKTRSHADGSMSCLQLYRPRTLWIGSHPWHRGTIRSCWRWMCWQGRSPQSNCAVISPSEYAPVTAQLIRKIISDVFPENYIAVADGGVECNQELLRLPFDYIFFTGSPRVGQIVMKAAAEHMTPVTLELGGKSPCIVDETACLPVAARRLAFGKCLNAGQTCVAPDYLLIQGISQGRISYSAEKRNYLDVRTRYLDQSGLSPYHHQRPL